MQPTKHKLPVQTLAIEAEKATMMTAMMTAMYGGKYYQKIGQYYDRLPEKTKEILRSLTSNDTKNIRHPLK